MLAVSLDTVHDVLQTLALLGTPVGLGFTVYQLHLNRRQAVTAFEDGLAGEYRTIIGRLPPEAFHSAAYDLGEEARRAMLQYFDLSNEQLRLSEADSKRITDETAAAWRSGIEDNMRLPTFQHAWDGLARGLPKSREGYFTELQAMVERLEDAGAWHRPALERADSAA